VYFPFLFSFFVFPLGLASSSPHLFRFWFSYVLSPLGLFSCLFSILLLTILISLFPSLSPLFPFPSPFWVAPAHRFYLSRLFSRSAFWFLTLFCLILLIAVFLSFSFPLNCSVFYFPLFNVLVSRFPTFCLSFVTPFSPFLFRFPPFSHVPSSRLSFFSRCLRPDNPVPFFSFNCSRLFPYLFSLSVFSLPLVECYQVVGLLVQVSCTSL